jgi:hypothetical protein
MGLSQMSDLAQTKSSSIVRRENAGSMLEATIPHRATLRCRAPPTCLQVDIQGALVGTPGVSGLSVEQRKRLTIAVEMVANPS